VSPDDISDDMVTAVAGTLAGSEVVGVSSTGFQVCPCEVLVGWGQGQGLFRGWVAATLAGSEVVGVSSTGFQVRQDEGLCV
jgi:hypothetical protein